MKTRTTCINCGDNFKIIDDDKKCQCGRYVRQVVDCSICGYTHKIRSAEFCRALHSEKGLKSLNKNLFLQESMDLRGQ